MTGKPVRQRLRKKQLAWPGPEGRKKALTAAFSARDRHQASQKMRREQLKAAWQASLPLQAGPGIQTSSLAKAVAGGGSLQPASGIRRGCGWHGGVAAAALPDRRASSLPGEA